MMRDESRGGAPAYGETIKTINTETMEERMNVDRARMERDAAICEEWERSAPVEVKEGVPPTRILSSLAAKYGLTAQAVESILRRKGLYNGAREFKAAVVHQQTEPCDGDSARTREGIPPELGRNEE